MRNQPPCLAGRARWRKPIVVINDCASRNQGRERRYACCRLISLLSYWRGAWRSIHCYWRLFFEASRFCPVSSSVYARSRVARRTRQLHRRIRSVIRHLSISAQHERSASARKRVLKSSQRAGSITNRGNRQCLAAQAPKKSTYLIMASCEIIVASAISQNRRQHRSAHMAAAPRLVGPSICGEKCGSNTHRRGKAPSASERLGPAGNHARIGHAARRNVEISSSMRAGALNAPIAHVARRRRGVRRLRLF